MFFYPKFFNVFFTPDYYIGGNLVRLSKESGMRKTRLPSAIPDSDTILLSVKNTGLGKLVRVRVIVDKVSLDRF